MSTTTYIIRTNGQVTDSRASATMSYTHARVDSKGKAHTWHTAKANATKAQRSGDKGLQVVAVEAHEGGKATVLKRLAKLEELAHPVEQPKADKRTAAKKATAKKATAPKATPKAEEAPAWTASTKKLPKATKVAHPVVDWRARIDAAGTNRRQVALAMGIAPMSFYRLLDGDPKVIPSAKMTAAFARAMGADVYELWTAVCDYELAEVLRSL